MGIIFVLTYGSSDWNRAFPCTLKYTSATKGTWELANPALVPWGLLAMDYKGKFEYSASNGTMEFWAQDARDTPGTLTRCFWIYEAPASKWDKKAKGADGSIDWPKNPAGTECDLNWMRWG